jgi:hypothetical protein
MASRSALVDDVRDVVRGKPPAKGAPPEAIVVRFAKGMVAKLDPESHRDRTWAEVLESVREQGQPAYVEIDPDSLYITALLLPRRFTVRAIRESPDGSGLELDLEISQARHYLRREHPQFDDLKKAIESAHRQKTMVLVTESLDASAIVDVRPVRTRPARGARR